MSLNSHFLQRPEHLASVSERQNLPVLHQNPIPMGTPHVSTEYYRNPSPEVLFVDQAAVSPEPSEDPTPVEKHSPPIPPVHTTPVPRAKSPQALRSSPLLYQQRVLKKPLLVGYVTQNFSNEKRILILIHYWKSPYKNFYFVFVRSYS